MDVTDRLYRSPDDRMLAGVAGGLAEMLDIDPSIVRIVWAVVIVLTGGLALLVYIVMAIVVPERPVGVEVHPPGGSDAGGLDAAGAATAPSGATARHARRRDRSDATRGGLVAGLILIVIGGFFLVRELIPSVDRGFWWPTVAIGLGVVLVVVALLPPRRSD
jgi:phage shock protein PspC (stress-responsive transcriptional regulator)